MNGRFIISLTYQWLDRRIPVADAADEDLLLLAKERILESAKAELRLVESLDPVLKIDAETDLERKQRILDLLDPPDPGGPLGATETDPYDEKPAM